MSFKSDMKQIRLSRNLTQSSLAKILGYSLETVVSYESRGRHPSASFVRRLDATLGTDLFSKWLTQEEEDMKRRDLFSASGATLAAILVPEVAQAKTNQLDLVNTLSSHLAQTEMLIGNKGLDTAARETVQAAYKLLTESNASTAIESAAYAVNRSAKVIYGNNKAQGVKIYQLACDIADNGNESIKAYCRTDLASAASRAKQHELGNDMIRSVESNRAHPLVTSYYQYVWSRHNPQSPDFMGILDDASNLHSNQDGPWWATQLFGGGEGQIHSSRSSCLIRAGYLDLAVEDLQLAVEKLGPERTRERAICAARLAESWKKLGEEDKATEAAEIARQLAASVKSNRVSDLISRALSGLAVAQDHGYVKKTLVRASSSPNWGECELSSTFYEAPARVSYP